MVEQRGHNVAPSLSGEAAANIATPPSQLAAASAAAAAPAVPLQERPKYVYGAAVPAHDSAEEQAREAAHGGAYSADPQAQTAYNAEAYGSYAKYDDAGAGVVGGVGVAVGGVYQDAQREYQGQQGYYDQSQYQQGYYDQSQHQQYYDQSTQQAYYDQSQQGQYVVDGQYAQQQQYDYSQQHSQYAAAQPAYPEQTAGYQPPHPYANRPAGNDAYGGM